jgi:acyl carrier protein
MSIFKQVQSVIAATLKVPPEKVSETTTDEDLAAWDSLGHVNLMIALEQEFDVFLDVEDFPKLNSVPAIMQYLQDNGAAP